MIGIYFKLSNIKKNVQKLYIFTFLDSYHNPFVWMMDEQHLKTMKNKIRKSKSQESEKVISHKVPVNQWYPLETDHLLYIETNRI